MAVQRDGKIVVGGDFTMFSGQLRNRIARLLPNGGLDDTSPFLIGANGPVHSIAVQEDQRIVIGGEFTTFNNQNVNRIARLNEYGFPEGISSFNPGMAVTNGAVFSISVQTNGKILVGGSFTAAPGVGRSFLTRLEANGQPESTATFNTGTGPSSPVRCLGIYAGGRILIGGEFVGVNQATRGRIARLNSDGTLESTATFNTGSGAAGTVRSLATQSDGKILVGGDFQSVNNQSHPFLARLQED